MVSKMLCLLMNGFLIVGATCLRKSSSSMIRCCLGENVSLPCSISDSPANIETPWMTLGFFIVDLGSIGESSRISSSFSPLSAPKDLCLL